MSSIVSRKQSKPELVTMNLLRAQVYAYRNELPTEIRHNQPQKTYMELQQKEYENGIKEEYVEVDYPITPDYVKSFEPSANYKNDLQTAMNAQPRGANLGDVSAIQELTRMDMAEVQKLRSELEALKTKVETKPVETPTEKAGENNG